MSLKNCHNFDDFRKLAKKKLPSPIFHYIDGGADDESTLRRNTESFSDCDLVPNILASVGKPDLSTTLFGRKIDMPIFLSPAAMQRLYHPDGDKKIGISIFLPKILVDKSGFPTLAKILGTKSQSSNESVFLLRVDSSSAPPSM